LVLTNISAGNTTITSGNVTVTTAGITTGTITNAIISTTASITGASINLAAGTTTVAPIVFGAGTTLLATQTVGATEYDGAAFYMTPAGTLGRSLIPATQMFALAASGTGITATVTGTNYFGATSNINLVASGLYEIEIVLYFTKTTAATNIYNLVFNAAPTKYTVYYEMSPITGIVATPGTTSTMIIGQSVEQTAATYAVTTGSLTTGVNHYARFKLFVVAGTATTLKINAYNGVAATITPLTGSYWKCTRLPNTNVGTYAA